MENYWKKGQFLINPKAMQWGIGIVTEDLKGDKLNVFFEHECNIKKLGLKMVNPEVIEDPGASRLFLENALVDEEIAAKSDRQPFPIILKKFLENFPDGFQGKMLTHYELEYKWKAHEYCKQELDKETWALALKNEDYESISTKIKRLYSKSNLLASFEMMDVGDGFKEAKGQKQLCTTFFDLLYGEGEMKTRFNDAVRVLGLYKMDKWPTISYPLFIRFPQQYMFVKPMMTKQAAENRGFDIHYSAQVNWGTYKRILEFSQDLFNRLSESDNQFLHPRDMIDIQSFMWCTYAKGWDVNEIANAKRKLGIL